jgi:hypothetical protein
VENVAPSSGWWIHRSGHTSPISSQSGSQLPCRTDDTLMPVSVLKVRLHYASRRHQFTEVVGTP